MGTSEAETSVSGKAERLLAVGEDYKTKLSGLTFSFNDLLEASKSKFKGVIPTAGH